MTSIENGEDGLSVRTKLNNVLERYDQDGFANVAALLADTSLTYSTVSSGQYIRTRSEGFAYQVAAFGATDHHVTTVGGVKLYVLPGNAGYNVKAFGALGDNSADDTAEIQKAVDVVAASGGVLHIPTGTYIVTTRITRLTSAKPFIIQGCGQDTVIKRGSGLTTTVMEFRQSDGVQVRDLLIDGQHGVLGAANHGLVIFESNFAVVHNVHAQDYTNSGILVYAVAGTHGNARISNCLVDGNGRSPVGILISGMYDSGMHGCTAIGCTTVGTGSDGYGLELKNECDGCYITDSYAKDCTVAVAFGQDITSTAVKNSRVSVVSRACNFAFVCGRAENNHIDIIAEADGASGGEQVVDLQTDSIGNTVRVTTRDVTASKRVARIRSGCTDNVIDVSCVTTLPTSAVVALFDAGSERNTVQLNRLGVTPMPTAGYAGLVIDNSTANNNTFRYLLYPRFESRTIASGAITIQDPSSESVIIDTEAAAATDDLDTINGPTFEGKTIAIRTLANSRDVVVKHNVGNIRLNGSADFTLDGVADTLTLRWNSALSQWCEVGRGNNI